MKDHNKEIRSLTETINQMMSGEDIRNLLTEDEGDDSGWSWSEWWTAIKYVAPIIIDIVSDRLEIEKELQVAFFGCENGMPGACYRANEMCCELGYPCCNDDYCADHPDDPACASEEEEPEKVPRQPTIDPEGGPVPDWAARARG